MFKKCIILLILMSVLGLFGCKLCKCGTNKTNITVVGPGFECSGTLYTKFHRGVEYSNMHCDDGRIYKNITNYMIKE